MPKVLVPPDTCPMCAEAPLTVDQPLCGRCLHDLTVQLDRRRQALLRLPPQRGCAA